MSIPPDTGHQDEWILDPDILDPDIIVFSGSVVLPAGTTVQHGGKAKQLFGKRKEWVSANWTQVVEQMKYLISSVENFSDSYELSEVQFQLGFSAEGTIVFIARGGIDATISATFRRKEVPASAPERPQPPDPANVTVHNQPEPPGQ
jgi:hypothetical protein